MNIPFGELVPIWLLSFNALYLTARFYKTKHKRTPALLRGVCVRTPLPPIPSRHTMLHAGSRSQAESCKRARGWGLGLGGGRGRLVFCFAPLAGLAHWLKAIMRRSESFHGARTSASGERPHCHLSALLSGGIKCGLFWAGSRKTVHTNHERNNKPLQAKRPQREGGRSAKSSKAVGDCI